VQPSMKAPRSSSSGRVAKEAMIWPVPNPTFASALTRKRV
jgi:hypothetical protein